MQANSEWRRVKDRKKLIFSAGQVGNSDLFWNRNCNYKNNFKNISNYYHISGNYYLKLGMQDHNNA